MTINEITEKIIESKNNDIAKAFTMHIGSLLLTNGIVPVMTEYTGNDVKNITDTDEYKLVMEYGITFKELDCSKHDKEIYSKAIDDFVEKLNAKCDGMIKEKWNSNVAPISWAEAYADFKDDIDEIAEQLKAGGENDRNTRIFKQCDNCMLYYGVGNVANKLDDKYCPRCSRAYRKAIDDFKKILTIEKIKEYAESDGFINLNNCSLMIYDISEQLKAGITND